MPDQHQARDGAANTALAPGELFPDLELPDHNGYARRLSDLVAGDLRAGLGARWTCLCDADGVALAQLGLRETTDTVNHPYVPSVFTLAPELRIHQAYNGYWYWGRATVDELRSDLRAISRMVRSDWDAPTA